MVGGLALAALLAVLGWCRSLAFAQTDSQQGDVATSTVPGVRAPDLATRVADLEAYVTNGAPKTLSSPGPGHNAWMMISSALVLFMTLPGLALFYGGLVRRKNVLSIMTQCFGCAGVVTSLWWLVGYSFVFSSGSPYLGGLKFALLRGVGATPNADYGAWVSHSVFAMYELMFAIITPALIVGAIAERMKYARRRASSRQTGRSSSAFSPASSRTSPPPSSRRRWATTMPSTPSACTGSEERSAPW